MGQAKQAKRRNDFLWGKKVYARACRSTVCCAGGFICCASVLRSEGFELLNVKKKTGNLLRFPVRQHATLPMRQQNIAMRDAIRLHYLSSSIARYGEFDSSELDILMQMSKRLQVILKDPEYREIQRAARSRRMSIAEWVRQALDLARRREPIGSLEKKLEAVRRATQYEYPAGDIESMLAQIEAGYTRGVHP